MANRESRSPIDSRPRVESPEDRERELIRKLTEASRMVINGPDVQRYVKDQLALELERDGIHFYALGDIFSHAASLGEVPYAFGKNVDNGGWLGARLDDDTLLMFAVDPVFHGYRDACMVLAKTF